MKFLVFSAVLILCSVGVLGDNSIQPVVAVETSNSSSRAKRNNSSISIGEASNQKTTPANIKKVICPNKIERIPFLSLPCDFDSECSIFGSKMVCCSNRCIQGVVPLKKEENPKIRKVVISSDVTTIATTTEAKSSKSNDFVCPDKNFRIPFFALPCETKSDCSIFGSKMVCCSRRCIEGVRKREIEKVSIIKEELVTEKNISIDRTSDQPIKVDIQKIEIPTTKTKSATLICPEGARIPFFSLLCTNNNDCTSLGDKMVCCKNRCITGVSPERNEINQITPKNKRIADQEVPNEISNSIGTKEYMTGENIQSNNSKVDNLVCPDKGVRIPFFSLPCVTKNDCTGKEMVCCSNRCIKGVLPKKPEIIHSPSWFGLVERNCPVDAIAEILEIKECETDSDCRPRICCPDQYRSQGNKSYCRTPQPSLHRFPLAERATEPFRVFASYIQCTPPPPPIFDLFPKSCNNALDCFPNLCCQEGDKKYCRPPKRSVLQLIAGVGQRFVPPDAAKKLIERLN